MSTTDSRRSYGTRSLELRTDKRGRATYHARFYSGGRQVQRRLGPKRQAGSSTGLTKTMAERAVAKLVEQQTRMVPVAQRVDLRTAGERYLEHLAEWIAAARNMPPMIRSALPGVRRRDSRVRP